VICTTLNAIRAHDPCVDGWAKLLAHLGKTGPDDEPLPLVVILDSNGLDDALWALRAVTCEDARIRRYAVWCARQVQHLMDDPRSLAALDVAERYAEGLATDAELRAAWAAAEAAAWGAARAAAEGAARAAAWAAAENAAHAVAWGAARAAALAAAWAAARAAEAAAEAAMRERQATEFRRVFGDEEVERE
jgi:hypothetical protein